MIEMYISVVPIVLEIRSTGDMIGNTIHQCWAFIRLSQNCTFLQTKKVILNTTFSHCLGQNHYRKPKIEKFYQFFKPANGVQSFTT